MMSPVLLLAPFPLRRSGLALLKPAFLDLLPDHALPPLLQPLDLPLLHLQCRVNQLLLTLEANKVVLVPLKVLSLRESLALEDRLRL